MPEAHSATYAVPTDHANSVRDETPGTFVTYSPREARSWRAIPTIGAKVGPGYDGDQGAFTAEHMSTGHADPRRVWDHPAGGGYPQPAHESLRPAAEALTSQPGGPGFIRGSLAPDRNRAGSTTADETRPSRAPFWRFLRPFDQWASQNMGHLDKIELAPPSASMPITQTGLTPDATTYPGGGQAPVGRMAGVGIQPNSYRLIPRPWDEQLVNSTPAPAPVSTESNRRSRGWRL